MTTEGKDAHWQHGEKGTAGTASSAKFWRSKVIMSIEPCGHMHHVDVYLKLLERPERYPLDSADGETS